MGLTDFENMRLLDDPRINDLLSEVSDFALCEIDLDGACTNWEAYSANYKRYTATEIIGQTLDAFYPEEQRPEYWHNLKLAAENGRAEGEGWRLRKDGTRSWMRFIILADRDQQGVLTGYTGIVFDATRQHDSKRALHESEEVYRALIQGLKNHIIIVLDKDGHVRKWNRDAPKILGCKEYQMEGAHMSRFFTDEDCANDEPQKALAITRRTGRYARESWRKRADGTVFRADVNIVPLQDDQGDFCGYGVVTRDITDSYNAQQKLASTQEALHQLEKLRSLGELTGGIAHDFNNLLTVVRGSAELLKSETLSAEKKTRHIDAIVETADRAAELTGQLLSFARQQPLRPKRIDLNAVVSGMSELMKRTLGGGVSILKTPGADLWDVRADPIQLENLILNAAINARDAMEGAGTLTLATQNIHGQSGEEVCLSISDTGSGIPPDVLERVFEPFFTTKGPGKGTGLGLSQAYGFAAQSGGRLKINSEVGRGTTLSLYLPRAEIKPDIGDTAHVQAIETTVPRGTRVLLVEDSRTVAVFAQSLLQDLGCEVVHAQDAEQALVALENEPTGFDIIFSDIVMPGRSGLDLAAEIRRQKPTLPILLATGYSEAAARGEGSEFPILPKPYKRDILSAKLCETMNAFSEAA